MKHAREGNETNTMKMATFTGDTDRGYKSQTT